MSLLKKLLLPTLVVLFPAISLAGQPSFEAIVVKIIDGDTITALDEQNTSFKIRLYGIDASESKQAFGQKAKQALSSAISSQNITVVDSGYAWVYRFDGNAIVPTYLKFEASAQKAVKGLWVDPNPVAPWEWRQQNQKSQKTKNRRTPQ